MLNAPCGDAVIFMIVGWKVRQGNWCYDPKDVQGIVANFYNELFTTFHPIEDLLDYVMERVLSKLEENNLVTIIA